MINSLILWIKKASRASATICLLSLISACSISPEVKYVEKIVYVDKPVVPQLVSECNVSVREGNRVRDYIVSERRLRNDLEICNMIIRERNKHESLAK